jgi:hypothetical protein
MSAININNIAQHEVWFAWRGYLVLRPLRAQPTPARRHPRWTYLGCSSDVLPALVAQQLCPPGGLASNPGRPGMLG